MAISASLSVGGVSPRRGFDLGICRVEMGVNSGGLGEELSFEKDLRLAETQLRANSAPITVNFARQRQLDLFPGGEFHSKFYFFISHIRLIFLSR